METARRKIAEVDAAMVVAQADILKAEGQLREAKGAQQQAQDELDTKRELHRRNPGIVRSRDIERLEVAGRRPGRVAAANAAKQATEIRVSSVLPAEKASAEAAAGAGPGGSATRPSFAPAWTGASSSSCSASATSSIR